MAKSKVIVLFREPKGKLALKFWPRKTHATIPEAITWFTKQFGKPPKMIQVAVLDKTVRQEVAMYAPGTRPF